MKHCDFFKLQAKNLLRDYKTQFWNEEEGVFDYEPRFFNDIDEIVMNFNLDEEKPFGLMSAQHLIAKLAGFEKWTEMVVASESAQEIGKLQLINRHETGGIFTNLVPSVIVENWKEYCQENNLDKVDDETKLTIFKEVFLGEGEIIEEVKKSPKVKLTKEYYLKHNPFGVSKWDTHVECLHCGVTYLFNETEIDDDGFIVCPVERCDGSLIDMMPAQQRTKTKLTEKYYLKHNPFVESKWDTRVKCLHCGETYLFNDAEIDYDGLIVCPIERCDGSLLDMMSISMTPNSNKPNLNKSKVGRNNLCPCNSGKKLKQCCGGIN